MISSVHILDAGISRKVPGIFKCRPTKGLLSWGPMLDPKTLPDPVEIVPPERPPDWVVEIPGSKSFTNRALVAAALAEGASVLSNASMSDDSERLVKALAGLGVRIESDPGARTLTVHGTGGRLIPDTDRFDLGNAGTATRFFLALACLAKGTFIVDGDERMRQRPIQDLVDALAPLGAKLRCVNGNGCPPVEVTADGLEGGETVVRGDVSSQFLSALLLAAPHARAGARIRIRGSLTSASYAVMTMSVTRAFGAAWEAEGLDSGASNAGGAMTLVIPAGRTYKPCDYTVEADAAGANYFLAMAAATGGRARVHGLGKRTMQGESRFVDLLGTSGCRIDRGADWTEVTGGPLRGGNFDMNACTDSAQTMAALALFASGKTVIRNVANLRVKETNRIAALATELTKVGAAVKELPDGLEITPPAAPVPAVIDTYDDHRMVMSFAVAGLKIPGLKIRNPACVSKSFPEFFDLLGRLGVRFR